MLKLSRRRFNSAFGVSALGAAIGLLVLPSRARADGDAVFPGPQGDGTAINGYDAVAYFMASRPVRGSSEFAHDHRGATWRFASAANRDAFAAEPERYAPRYNGYCAYAMAKGRRAKTEPEAWTIVDGRLYLNFDLATRERWLKDTAGHIEQAEANWPSFPHG